MRSVVPPNQVSFIVSLPPLAVRQHSASPHDRRQPSFAALPASGKLLGLDLGTKTIGVAISDGMRYSATPLETIQRTKFTADAERLLRPDRRERRRSASSSACRSTWTARRARGCSRPAPLPAIWRRKRRCPIVFWDERLSTSAVTRMLIEADTRRDKRAEVVDKLAASYILQGSLDRLRKG